MKLFLFALAAFLAVVSFLAIWPDLSDAIAQGRTREAVFFLADALDTAAFAVFLALPMRSLWNLPAMAVVALNGVGLLTQPGRDVGAWEHVPGQAATAGWFAISIALLLTIFVVVERWPRAQRL